MTKSAKEVRKETLDSIISIVDNKVNGRVHYGKLSIKVDEIPISLSDEVVSYYQEAGYKVTIQKTTETDRVLEISWDI